MNKDFKLSIDTNQQVELKSFTLPRVKDYSEDLSSKREMNNSRTINDIIMNDGPKNKTIFPESLSKAKTLQFNLYKMLETSIKYRKQIIANSNETSKILYCSCCITTNKEKIINRAIEYVEQCSELGTIVKRNREIDILKKIILNKEQRIMEILPSNNIKTKIEDEEKNEEETDEYLDKLSDSNEVMKSIDLSKRINKVLVKNVVSSIV